MSNVRNVFIIYPPNTGGPKLPDLSPTSTKSYKSQSHHHRLLLAHGAFGATDAGSSMKESASARVQKNNGLTEAVQVPEGDARSKRLVAGEKRA
jgi:hypothetical protein